MCKTYSSSHSVEVFMAADKSESYLYRSLGGGDINGKKWVLTSHQRSGIVQSSKGEGLKLLFLTLLALVTEQASDIWTQFLEVYLVY